MTSFMEFMAILTGKWIIGCYIEACNSLQRNVFVKCRLFLAAEIMFEEHGAREDQKLAFTLHLELA